jgi:AcrR family transcriptional regulator
VRYPKERKEQSRDLLIAEAGKAFRKQGYGGVGVDGLAKGAHLTSGAFYVHFSSKKEAFLEAVRVGLDELRAGIEATQSSGNEHWLGNFADFYLTEKRSCDLTVGCALPSLSAEVERAGAEAKSAYEEKLCEIIATLSAGMPGSESERKQEAWTALALLAGGLMLARTVQSPALAEEIASAVRVAVGNLQGS